MQLRRPDLLAGPGGRPRSETVNDSKARENVEIGVDSLLACAEGTAKAGDIELLSRAVSELIDHPPQGIRTPYFSHRCDVSLHYAVDIGIVPSHPVPIFERPDLGEPSTHQQIDDIRALEGRRS